MSSFLQLEGGYLIIGAFILAVSFFVGTRPFVGDGKSYKKIVPYTAMVLAIFILGHYWLTTSRISEVKDRFNSGGAIICESKAQRKVAQSIIIDPKKPQGWILDGDQFISPQFSRSFHTSRCIVYEYPTKRSSK